MEKPFYQIYFYISLVSAMEAFALAPVLLQRNWGKRECLGLAATSLALGLWLFGVGNYFRDIPPATALFWARVTHCSAVLLAPLFLHAMCLLIGIERQNRWAVLTSYATGLFFVGGLVTDKMGMSLKAVPYLHHYVEIKHLFLPLIAHIELWHLYTFILMVRHVKNLAGYKRHQVYYLIFFDVAIHLTLATVLIPMQYNINIPPYGLILVPFELAVLGYAFAKVRLMDFSQAAGKILTFAVTLAFVAGASLTLIGIVTFLVPGFFNEAQIFFTLWLIVMVAFGVAVVVPRIAPYVEQRMRETLFAQKYSYQRQMLETIGKLTTLADVDTMLDKVMDACLEQMGVNWAAVFFEDEATGAFVLKAQRPSGGGAAATEKLPSSAAIVQWLRDSRKALVREEIARSPTLSLRHKTGPTIEEMDRMRAAIVVPLVHKDWVAGMLVLGERRSGEMFTVMDVELLESMGREFGLALYHRRKESRIMQSERLITLGTLAAGIAHEIRNPLASIGTFASLMAEKGHDPQFREEFGRVVATDVERINKVVTTVLGFSRRTDIDTHPCNINETVEKALSMLQPVLKNKSVPIERDLKEVYPVRINPDQIVQVLLNLIGNAIDAVPNPGGKVKVSTFFLPASGSKNSSRSQDYVVVEVADNGAGIPDSVQKRLFEPFFTTKKGGTGLGLAISQKIASDHGGFISVDSKLGRGSIFRLHLPLAESGRAV